MVLGPITTAFRIKNSNLIPTIKLSVFLSLLGSLQLFDIIMPLTGGGPSNVTHSMVTYLYYFWSNANEDWLWKCGRSNYIPDMFVYCNRLSKNLNERMIMFTNFRQFYLYLFLFLMAGMIIHPSLCILIGRF